MIYYAKQQIIDIPVHKIAEEHAILSDHDPGQGEPPFTGVGLLQDLYRVLVPPTHVFLHEIHIPHELQFPFTKGK